MTAAERLEQLAGITGSAASLLMAIGAGATAAARLVAHSGLTSASAAIHLLTDVTSEPPPPAPTPGGNSYVVGSGHRPFRRPPAVIAPREEDEALLMTGLI